MPVGTVDRKVRHSGHSFSFTTLGTYGTLPSVVFWNKMGVDIWVIWKHFGHSLHFYIFCNKKIYLFVSTLNMLPGHTNPICIVVEFLYIYVVVLYIYFVIWYIYCCCYCLIFPCYCFYISMYCCCYNRYFFLIFHVIVVIFMFSLHICSDILRLSFDPCWYMCTWIWP